MELSATTLKGHAHRLMSKSGGSGSGSRRRPGRAHELAFWHESVSFLCVSYATYLRCGEDRCVAAGRQQERYDSGTLLSFGERRQRSGDLGWPLADGGLVDHRGLGGGVPEALLQLAQGGAGSGGHNRSEVAEVVHAHVRATGLDLGAFEHPVKRRPRQIPVAVRRREHETLTAECGVVLHVVLEGGQDVRGDRYGPDAGVALGFTHDRAALHRCDGLADMHDPVLEVEVAPT